MTDNVKIEFAYPSVKEQTKQAFVGTAIGLLPLAAIVGGLAVWSKIAERRNKKPDLKVVEDPAS